MWSLYRANKKRNDQNNKVAPGVDQDVVMTNDSIEEEENEKSKLRRSSSVFVLVNNKNAARNKGTALFIAATLLQREMIECLVPIQAAFTIPLLYWSKEKSNSLVYEWDDADLRQSLM